MLIAVFNNSYARLYFSALMIKRQKQRKKHQTAKSNDKEWPPKSGVMARYLAYHGY